jgi:NitT/TauT family transport system substrate-binding protein
VQRVGLQPDLHPIMRQRMLAMLVAACVAIALASCMRPPETALRIGTNVWIGSEPLYLARELGNLDPAVVQLVEYPPRAKSCAPSATRRSTAW